MGRIYNTINIPINIEVLHRNDTGETKAKISYEEIKADDWFVGVGFKISEDDEEDSKDHEAALTNFLQEKVGWIIIICLLFIHIMFVLHFRNFLSYSLTVQ